MSDRFKPKPKQGKALWTTIRTPGIKSQVERVHPERTKAGGVKAHSQAKRVRDAVYNAINGLFAAANPMCQCCHLIFADDPPRPHARDDTHHVRGKTGLLYFDVRYFKSCCRRAHDWIHAHPTEAQALGLLVGDKWRVEE